MAFAVMNLSSEMKSIVPISRTEDCSVDLVTVRTNYVTNPLTYFLKNLPPEIYSHCVRVSVIARILAKNARSLPENMSQDAFTKTVWLGGLYHQLGSFADDASTEQLPGLTEDILRENYNYISSDLDADPDMVIDIACRCCEGADDTAIKGGKPPFAVALVGLADMLERLISGKNVTKSKIEQAYTQIDALGDALFGEDVMECLETEQTKDEISELYLNYEKRKKSWT